MFPVASKTSQLEQLVASLGFELVRTKRHHVWRHGATGRTLVTPVSASDRRAEANVRALLRRWGYSV